MTADPFAGTQHDAERSVLGGRYEVLGLLGSGGMGNVYRAFDRSLGEVVAVKVMRPEIAGATGAAERFRREVRLARRVTHPSIARVHDIGEVDGALILTMELIDGVSLAGRLAERGRMSVAETVEVARSIAAGVGAAHAAGVVHRDLKPDNVLLAKDGRVVVTDFGIARAVAEHSQTVGFVGTPAYMAPEQIDERMVVDHRADIYALGTVLFQSLTGEPAWRGESFWSVVSARLLEPPPDPSVLRPGLPESIRAITLRCMQKEPADRFQSMLELEQALASIECDPSMVTSQSPRPAGRPLETPSTDKRVVVLPFANLGADADSYVAEGLTEDLVDLLSVAPGLRVRSRGTVSSIASADAREIGRLLDVHVVVEGSVRRIPAGYRVNARLISVLDGFQIWAKRFDVREEELLTQIDAIGATVAEALSSPVEVSPRSAADAAAVDLYLRARQAYNVMFSGDRTKPVELFGELVRRTPDDPRALAGWVLSSVAQDLWPPQLREELLAAANRAVELSPTLPDGHVARAAVLAFEGEYAQAIVHALRASKLSPSHLEASELVGRTLAAADHDDCLKYLEAARASDPGFELVYLPLCEFLEFRQEHERVEEILADVERRGLGVALMVRVKLAIWRNDRELAQALETRLDSRHPMHQLAQTWLQTVLGRDEVTPRGPPGLPAGMVTPRFLQWFERQTAAELACVRGDMEAVALALRALDELQCCDLAWLDRCAVLAPFRDATDYTTARARFAARAEEITAGYRRSLPTH